MSNVAESTAAFRSLSRAMFLGFVRDRTALVFSILIPVLFLVLLGSIYKGSTTPQDTVIEVGRVGLLDQARGPQLGKVMTITRAPAWRRAGRRPQGHRRCGRAAAGQHPGRALLDRRPDHRRHGERGVLLDRAAGQPGRDWAPPAYQLTAQQVEDTSLKPIQYLAPGLLGWAIASGAAFGAAITLVNWRQNKLLRRLRLSPVSTGSVVHRPDRGERGGRRWSSWSCSWPSRPLPYFGLKLTASWWMAIPVVVAGTLAFMAIGLLVGAVAKTQQAATAIANLIILPMAFLGGAFIPLDFAPNWIREVSYAMPLRYLVTGMQNVMARGEGPVSALPAIGILLAFTVVLTVIAIRAFRWDDI